jgi:hypothetical protein
LEPLLTQVPPLPFHAIQDHSAFAMKGTKEASRVQWMWRLLFSALLCLPAIFMLVAGTWNERPGVSSESPAEHAPTGTAAQRPPAS